MKSTCRLIASFLLPVDGDLVKQNYLSYYRKGHRNKCISYPWLLLDASLIHTSGMSFYPLPVMTLLGADIYFRQVIQTDGHRDLQLSFYSSNIKFYVQM